MQSTNPVKTWQNNVAKIWTIFGGILGFANNAAQFKYFSSNNKDFQRKKCWTEEDPGPRLKILCYKKSIFLQRLHEYCPRYDNKKRFKILLNIILYLTIFKVKPDLKKLVHGITCNMPKCFKLVSEN